MKAMFHFIPCSFALGCAVQAAFTFESGPIIPSKHAVPDGSFSGLVSYVDYTSIAHLQLTKVEVSLTISGGYNGDLYAYLWHETPDHRIACSVLLNRPGRTSTDSFGYADAGLNITLSDTAAREVHLYGGNGGDPLTGSWQPDARTASPLQVTGGSPRQAFLNVFNGLNPNGRWALSLYDVSSGDQSALDQWSLRMELVPEPADFAVWVAAGLGVFALGRRITARA